MRAGIAVLLAASALAAGCASSPYAGAPASAANRAGLPADAPASGAAAGAATGAGAVLPLEQPLTGASAALLDQSRDQREDGNLGGAAATIERALTIEPDAAALWMELAEIRRDQGDFQLAEEMARKALTLTPADSLLAERARRLLGR